MAKHQHIGAPPSIPIGDTPRVLARLPVVLEVTGLGRSTIYRWIADGSFPPPVRLGPRAVASGAGQTWIAGRSLAPLHTTDRRRAPGPGRAQPGASAPLTRRAAHHARVRGQVAVQPPARRARPAARTTSSPWLSARSRVLCAGRFASAPFRRHRASFLCPAPSWATRAELLAPAACTARRAGAARTGRSTGPAFDPRPRATRQAPWRSRTNSPSRCLRSRPSSRAFRCHSRSVCRLPPRVICGEASASMPRSLSFSAKVSRQRRRSAWRGLRR
jgi:prophage regulatory protein